MSTVSQRQRTRHSRGRDGESERAQALFNSAANEALRPAASLQPSAHFTSVATRAPSANGHVLSPTWAQGAGRNKQVDYWVDYGLPAAGRNVSAVGAAVGAAVPTVVGKSLTEVQSWTCCSAGCHARRSCFFGSSVLRRSYLSCRLVLLLVPPPSRDRVSLRARVRLDYAVYCIAYWTILYSLDGMPAYLVHPVTWYTTPWVCLNGFLSAHPPPVAVSVLLPPR